MDEYVDILLTEDLFCGVTLPRLALRSGLVEQKLLQERKSALNIDDDAKSNRSEDSYKWQKEESSSRSSEPPKRKRSRSREPPDSKREEPSKK